MEDNKYSWVPFYEELAEHLLVFKNNRKDLVEIVKRSYSETGLHMPRLEERELFDIDPWTLYGTFNKGIKLTSRIEMCKFYKKEFNMKNDVPQTFEGIPLLNNQNATYYWFASYRGDHDIDMLWDLFEAALEYKHNQNELTKSKFIKCFNSTIMIKGVGNSKITMGLFWIAPNTFINLDQRNYWYLYESKQISDDIIKELPVIDKKISGELYFNVLETIRRNIENKKINVTDLIDLSKNAWEYSEFINKQNKSKLKIEDDKGDGLADKNVDTVHYWIYAPGEQSLRWQQDLDTSTMSIGWGDLGNCEGLTKTEISKKIKEYYSKNSSYKNSVHAIWQFINKVKVNDIIFVRKGIHTIIGRGIVTSDFIFNEECTDEFKNIRNVDWTDTGEWEVNRSFAHKTLTDITQYTNDVQLLNGLFDETEELESDYKKYTVDDFLNDVYISKKEYEVLVDLLKTKKNIVLEGAPGVGKTFISKRLAYSILGCKNQEQVMMIQFHQSYSYEDFIEGFRPNVNGEGFELRKGAFYQFCKKAEEDSDNDYFFLIDEINRGNISKIFGELFMLIENDKRGNQLHLLYSDELFAVPSNVYIIGMMNTADRSLAMLDYALRRRFAFYEVQPKFHTQSFQNYIHSLNSDKLNNLIDVIIRLNNDIKNDESLGSGFCIGHSYFCNIKEVTDLTLSRIVEYEIIPLLKEYWFDDQQIVQKWIDQLRSVIQ